MYSVKFSKTALKSFKRLDRKIQTLALIALERLKKNPKIGTPLIGNLKGFWKLRFSRYRIIYQLENRKLIIIVFDVGHRKDIYKNRF
ncbi:MAG: type II toxin-antitoxin system RelE/ParE family toxin [Patescibacteria group bacterium]